MSWISIIPGIIKQIGEIFVPATKTILGDQSSRDTAAAAENAAAREAYGKEFSYSATHRTSFDALMDGINRIPRPLMALGSAWLFVWCMVDPDRFSVAMTALQLVPENLWSILMMIAAFYFTSRAIEKLTYGPYVVPKATRKLAVEVMEREEAAGGDKTASMADLGVSPLLTRGALTGGVDDSKETLLRLAGYGPGKLHTKGYTGRLPVSRGRGWRNPIASKYAAV